MKRSWSLLCLILILAVSLAACESDPSAKTTLEVTPTKAPVAPEKIEAFKEAPMLNKLVSAGTLKPVAERMPAKEDIMVEKVLEETGVYGGDWKLPWSGPNDRWTVGQPSEEPLFRFSKDGSTVEPNVAKGYDVNKDSTEFTIYLRKGMKWSDGMPFTADDVLFYWEHMLTKETFGKKIYDAYYSVDPVTGDKALAKVTKVDDYTFKVTHKYPSVQFLERVAIDNA